MDLTTAIWVNNSKDTVTVPVKPPIGRITIFHAGIAVMWASTDTESVSFLGESTITLAPKLPSTPSQFPKMLIPRGFQLEPKLESASAFHS
jgi:hypothetical protein